MLVSCTRGVVDDTLAGPTAGPGTVTRLTITPVAGGTIIIGQSIAIVSSGALPTDTIALGAYAEFGDGRRQYVAATWTSSDTGVLTVDNNTLTGVARGTATITARFQGQSDDAPFEVMGGITGNWAGTYEVQQCVGSSGSMSELMCMPPNSGRTPGFAYVGATLPIAMELTETATTVSGVVTMGAVRATLTGTSRGGGFFSLQGVVAIPGGALTITHWDTLVQGDAMQGFINYEVRLNGVPGVGGAGIRLLDMTRR